MLHRTTRTWVTAIAVLFASVVLSACGAPATATTKGATSATVWLCKPGAANDPCDAGYHVTTVQENGTRSVATTKNLSNPAIDCFYVYPTVSTESSDNANLKVQASEIDVAISQASPFSQECRVYAPMYRQRTVDSLLQGLGNDPQGNNTAYQSVLSGWNEYLKTYNHGRPFVLIGHSQGAAMLILLIERQIDNNAALRRRMVSAIILGGNVAVPTGKIVGATFKHIPLCTAPTSTSCVIAYSSYPGEPPANSFFGRPGQGVSLQSGQSTTKGVHVACVNPGAIGGAATWLTPWFVTSTEVPPGPAVSTLFVAYPHLYSATCESAGGATWLQVTTNPTTGGRPTITEGLGPQWGYHVDDVNIATDNLLLDVARETTSYVNLHR